MRRLLFFVALLLLAHAGLAANRFSGNWKLNTHKSTGPQPPTEAILIATDDGQTQTITVTRSAPDGSPMKTSFSFPLKGGNGQILDAPFTSVKAKPAKPNTEIFLFFIARKPAMFIRSILSADGNTVTTTREVIKGPMPLGKYTDIWERQ